MRNGIYCTFAETPKSPSKLERVSKCEMGAILAARFPDGKTMSGKVIKKSRAAQKLMLELKNGLKVVVDFEDVIWIKSHPEDMWPKGVLEEMKRTARKEYKPYEWRPTRYPTRR